MEITKTSYITNVKVKKDEIAKIRLLYGSKKTVEAWQKELGADIVCNGALFNDDDAETPIETYKSGGVIYNESDWCRRGFGIAENGKVIFGDFNDWFYDFTVAFPTLVWESKKSVNFRASTISGLNPRTIFSKTEDGFMITAIDGRQKGKPGMTIEEAADYMKSQGVWHAANLDGGGSTRVVVRGEVVNSPCENRAIRNVLAIWLKKEDEDMTAQKIISKAASQIGVKESPSGSNTVKYNTEYYGSKVEGPSYPWCCAFVWWVFKECGMSKLFFGGDKTAYCPTVETYYRQKGQWYTSPKVGDLALFDFNNKGRAHHIGIVEKVNSNGSVVTIEGNTSLTNNDNGGKVMRRTRKLSTIRGFARPNYTGQKSDKGENTVTVELTKLSKGSKGSQVKTLQRLLIALGYSCGSSGADGDFGNGTYKAVVKYQKAKGLGADGIVGTATWTSILKNG